MARQQTTEAHFDVRRSKGRHKFASAIRTTHADAQGRRVSSNGIKWRGLDPTRKNAIPEHE